MQRNEIEEIEEGAKRDKLSCINCEQSCTVYHVSEESILFCPFCSEPLE